MQHMTETERYLFDLKGYMVIKSVLSMEQVKEINDTIDTVLHSRDDLGVSSYIHTGLDEETLEQGNKDPARGPVDVYAGLLLDWGEPIRRLVGHEKILPYMIELIGPDLRLDHQYAIIMKSDSQYRGRHILHSGGTPYNPSQYYHFRDHRFHNGLTVASFCLTDVPPGAGGFCCIPGSHKSNIPLPEIYASATEPPECVVQIPMSAGDVLLFTEALTHGALTWEAEHQRRALLFKYCPGHLQWEKKSPFASSDHPWNDCQRQLLELPYVGNRRPVDHKV